jgi:hypothetical protein
MKKVKVAIFFVFIHKFQKENRKKILDEKCVKFF